jgi:signal transduction histidine kinase
MTRWAPSEVQVASRFAARGYTPGLWIAFWVVAAVGEAIALRPVLFDRDTAIAGLDVVFSLVGGSFAAFGLVAWRRRPDSRSGALMTATGYAFLLSALLAQLSSALGQTAWGLLTDLWIPFFAVLLLTLQTSGRLQPGIDRWLVAAFILPLFVLQVVYMLASEPDGHLLLAFPHAGVADAVDTAQRSLLAGACAATVLVLAWRWLKASRPRRRALMPSVAGGLVLLFFTTLLVNDLITGTRSQALLWLAACSLVTVPAAFLAGLLRSRLARGGLSELFLGLGSTRGGDLRGALAKTLGDPRLVVAYWLPEYGTYADGEGRAVTLPAPGEDRSVAPVERDGRRVAALFYDASLDDDPELVAAVSAAAAIAIENAHLHAEAQARVTELRASRERIVAAGDAERRRLERNLHDGAQQRLVGIALQLRLLRNRIDGDESAEHLVTTASEELALSLAELRELARGLHPAVLEHGLPAALNALATRSSVATSVTVETSERLPEPVELAAYFVACEALTNVSKYAGATCATVRVWRDGPLAAIEIADDGVGGADDSRGTGLRGLADRVEALGGRLHVTSPRGHGTTVVAELPCRS